MQGTVTPAWRRHWRDYVIYLVFAGIFLFFAAFLHDRGFLSAGNLMNIARQTAMIAIMAVGMTFVLSAAEIDLSMGSVVALSALTSALTLRHTGLVPAAALAGMGAGIFVGAVNGFFVAKVGIPSFLVTLGMTGIVTGVARWISGLQSVPINNDIFTWLFGSGNLGPVPILFVWTLAVAALGSIGLRRTQFGREVLATGGNKTAALYSGVKVNQIKFYVMLLNSTLAALAGILYSGRLHGARYTLGENDVMLVVAAVIIGGTSLFGGKGTVIGSIAGALIMGMVNNGLILMGLSVDQQMIFRGVIIIMSVTLTMGKK